MTGTGVTGTKAATSNTDTVDTNTADAIGTKVRALEGRQPNRLAALGVVARRGLHSPLNCDS